MIKTAVFPRSSSGCYWSKLPERILGCFQLYDWSWVERLEMCGGMDERVDSMVRAIGKGDITVSGDKSKITRRQR